MWAKSDPKTATRTRRIGDGDRKMKTPEMGDKRRQTREGRQDKGDTGTETKLRPAQTKTGPNQDRPKPRPSWNQNGLSSLS